MRRMCAKRAIVVHASIQPRGNQDVIEPGANFVAIYQDELLFVMFVLAKQVHAASRQNPTRRTCAKSAMSPILNLYLN